MRQNSQKQIIIGVTGGTGSGKTTFSRMLGDEGARVINADAIVHEMYRNDEKIKERIAENFGEELIRNGEVDRKKLSLIVFTNENKLKLLSQIVHKRVGEIFREKISADKENRYIVLDVPIPVKEDFLDLCDYVVVVRSSEAKRKQRIIDRGGISEKEANLRISSQMSSAEYDKHADIVIDNDDDLDALRQKARELLEELCKLQES